MSFFVILIMTLVSRSFVEGIFVYLTYNRNIKNIHKIQDTQKKLVFSFIYAISTGIYSYFTHINSTTISATHLLFSAVFIFAYFCIESKKWNFKECSYIFAFSVFLNLIKECSYIICFKAVQFISVFVELPNNVMVNLISAVLVLILHIGVLLILYKKNFIQSRILKILSSHQEFLTLLIGCLCTVVYVKQHFIEQQNLGTEFFEAFSYYFCSFYQHI